MTIKLTDVSRRLAHALRHEPWLYELELDDQGWVPVETVLKSLRRENAKWKDLSEADLEELVATQTKRRYELTDGKIRALYGHSVPQKLLKIPAAPPDLLFHGTARTTLPLIRETGLLPMQRQYVHLSTDTEMAEQVGARKGAGPVILRIAAARAHAAGVPFYIGNERVWLADRVPAEFIEFDSP